MQQSKWPITVSDGRVKFGNMLVQQMLLQNKGHFIRMFEDKHNAKIYSYNR